MLMRRRNLVLGLLGWLALPKMARGDAFLEFMPTAERVGTARFKVMFFKIYDAELFAPNGRFDPKGPYGLRLTYLVDAKKDRIVSSTVKEMKRQKAASKSTIESWIPLMERHFIAMDKGGQAGFLDTGDGRLLVTANGQVIGEIDDRKFITALMDVWLGPKVRDKEFQDRLMGRAR